MAIRELTCIICPKGCALKAELDENGNVLGVIGNTCKRGAEYAEAECTNPMRTVTSTMRCSDGTVIPVKTIMPIPKADVHACMHLINKGVVTLPVHVGDIVIAGVFGSDIAVTENRA